MVTIFFCPRQVAFKIFWISQIVREISANCEICKFRFSWKNPRKNKFRVICKTKWSHYFFVPNNSLSKHFKYLKPFAKNLRFAKFANFDFHEKIYEKMILAQYVKLDGPNIFFVSNNRILNFFNISNRSRKFCKLRKLQI